MSTAYEYITQSNSHDNQSSLRLVKHLMPRLVVIEDAKPALETNTEYDVIHEYKDDDGVTVRNVSFFDISKESPDSLVAQYKIAKYVEEIDRHPEWRGPEVKINDQGEKELICNNPVSQEMYGSMPAMASWRTELVPGAVALYPLQYPEEKFLPNGIEIDDATRSMFTHSLDAIGIRTRAKVMSHVAANYINEKGATNWTSLACGAAVPVLNAIKDNQDNIHGIDMKLVDFDPSALGFASDLAIDRGLKEGEDFEIMNRNLLKDLIATDRLVKELGEESMELVDALGIFEYFNENLSARFLSNAYKLVKPGGALVAANMLDTHPQIHFNQRVIGWPTIYPRSIDELKVIIEKAGIDTKNVSMTIPSDGIYAVMEIKK